MKPLNERNTLGSSPAGVPGSDAFDRIIELLQSSVDMEQRVGERLCRAADRILGSDDNPTEANPSIPIQPTIASLLADLERAQSYVQRQLNRFLEHRI